MNRKLRRSFFIGLNIFCKEHFNIKLKHSFLMLKLVLTKH